MSLQPTFQVIQSASNTYMTAIDTTGAYDSVNNPGGYGGSNLALTAVGTIGVSITFLPYPAGSTPITYPTPQNTNFPSDISNFVLLFPFVPNPSSYSLFSQFVLTPSQLGFTGGIFPDGIYIFTFCVMSNDKLEIYDLGQFAPAASTWTPTGGTVVDLTTGHSLGTLGVGAINNDEVNVSLPGIYLPSIGDTLQYQVSSVPTGPNVTLDENLVLIYVLNYITTVQQLITVNSDALLANYLAKYDPFCNCDCDCFCQPFIILMAAKAQAGAGENNTALDSLAKFNLIMTKYC